MDTISTAHAPENESAGDGLRDRRIRVWTGRLVVAVKQWWRKRSTRRALAELDESLLHDIGVTPQEARDEMKKSLFLLSDTSRLSGDYRDVSRYDRW